MNYFDDIRRIKSEKKWLELVLFLEQNICYSEDTPTQSFDLTCIIQRSNNRYVQ